jgi:hypothetical protein
MDLYLKDCAGEMNPPAAVSDEGEPISQETVHEIAEFIFPVS